MNEKLKELVLNYLKLTEAKRSISLGMKVKNEMKRMFEDCSMDIKIFDNIDTNLDVDENFNQIVGSLKNNQIYLRNSEHCKVYIEYLLTNKDTKTRKNKLKEKLKEKIKMRDPMLLNYLEYLITINNAKKRLQSHLVNENLETISERYLELKNLIK